MADEQCQSLATTKRDVPGSRELRAGRTRVGARAGWTLVEISIVILVIGIILALGLPSLMSRMPGYRIRDAVSRLEGQLRAARIQSMSISRPMKVAINTSAKTMTAAADLDGSGSITSNETSTIVLSEKGPVLLATTCVSGVFQPNGGFDCSTGYWRVTVSHVGGADEYVYVFAGGHVERSETKLD